MWRSCFCFGILFFACKIFESLKTSEPSWPLSYKKCQFAVQTFRFGLINTGFLQSHNSTSRDKNVTESPGPAAHILKPFSCWLRSPRWFTYVCVTFFCAPQRYVCDEAGNGVRRHGRSVTSYWATDTAGGNNHGPIFVRGRHGRGQELTTLRDVLKSFLDHR